MASNLDANQIFQQAFDDATGRLKVDIGSGTVSGGGSTTITIDAADDSIRIGNGVTPDYLKVNSDGSINVNVTEVPSFATPILAYNAQTSVPKDTDQTVTTHTVTSGKTFYLTNAQCSASSTAEFTIVVNGSPIAKQRSGLADFNGNFNFGSGYQISSGSVVSVIARHGSDSLAEMNANIQGIEE